MRISPGVISAATDVLAVAADEDRLTNRDTGGVR